MPIDFDTLAGSQRLLIEAELQPIQGTRFQPTGFPNLGAATYPGPEGGTMLLVESAQSVANRLEAACWDEAADDWIAPLSGVPVVKVSDGAAPLTNSVLEAHRLNSPYIENTDWFATFKTELGYDEKAKRPIDMRGKVYPAILKYDPNALLHGFFLESITGTIRSPRAVSGFIEAEQVQTASSGGVKNDRVDASGKSADAGGAAEGYGNVPFARDEYASPSIKAYFNLDLAQIRGFGLGAAAERFLIGFALLKIRRFLEDGLRLRTACDLGVVGEPRVTRPAGLVIPSLSELEAEIPGLVSAVTGFASPPVTKVTWSPKKKGKATAAPGEAEADSPQS